MSGMTRSTPRSSDSGNIMPASMTIMSSPSRRPIMFMPNSPRPPSGMAVRDCAGLLKKEVSPQCNRESYHSGRGSQLTQLEDRDKAENREEQGGRGEGNSGSLACLRQASLGITLASAGSTGELVAVADRAKAGARLPHPQNCC